MQMTDCGGGKYMTEVHNRKMFDAAIKAADYMTDYTYTHWWMNIERFDWDAGVGLFGIFAAYKMSGDKKYYDFILNWMDRHMGEADKHPTVNSTTPLLTAAFMYEITKSDRLLNRLCSLADNILENAPLTDDGALEHTVMDKNVDFSRQIWADTLFMACLFLAKMWTITKQEKYKQFVIEQFMIHHKVLSDGKGLYFHGYDYERDDHMSSIRWGRANSWIIYSSAIILDMFGEFSERKTICEYVKKHADALMEIQRTDGGFCTILDDFTSYEETSATVAIAAGMKLGVKLEVLNEKANNSADEAIEYVLKNFRADGAVDGVSIGTSIMKDAEEYKNIARKPTLYGQGLFILAIYETLKDRL